MKTEIKKAKSLVIKFLDKNFKEQEVIYNMLNGSITNAKLFNFSENIKYLLNKILINTKVAKILKLEPGDQLELFIKNLKDYRNPLAHSNFLKLPVGDENIIKALKFLERIRQILLLLLYSDMGINIKSLFKNCYGYFPLKNCMKENHEEHFDMVEMAREAGVLFLKIKHQIYETIKIRSPNKSVPIVLTKVHNNLYNYNEEYTAIILEFYKAPGSEKDSRIYLASKIHKSVTYESHCYLECKGHVALERWGVYLVIDENL